MSKRWMSSGYLQAAPSGKVDHDKGIIEGVSVCTVGEAKGHGVNLDSEFVGRVAELGAAKRTGLKARFGHPNMCSTALGTFIGRFKNFRVVGDQAKADLFLSNEAKETPHGNLYDYVLGMADNEADMFGTSIVFTPGKAYKRDRSGNKVIVDEWNGDPLDDEQEYDAPLSDEVFIECEELHACDAVDDPAANDGLFSRFSQETVAGQITEFLDLNPQVWGAIHSNPSIVEALARYGDKVDEFMERYRAYREQNGKGHAMTDERTNSEQLEEASVTEPEAPETPEEQAAEETAEPVEAETPEGAEEAAEEPAVPEPEPEQEEEPAELSRAEFVQIVDEFGAEIAAQTVKDGGNYASALKLAYSQAREQIDALEKQCSEMKATRAGTPVPVEDATKHENKSLFKTGK